MRDFNIRALGEIAIRCTDMKAMIKFYRDVIGLEIMAEFEGITFFDIGEGHAGHRSVLALFTSASGRPDIHPSSTGDIVSGPNSSLHHIALAVDFGDQRKIIEWYQKLNLDYSVQEFGWVGWRGIFTRDPEGNTVELVAYDASILEKDVSE